MPTQDYINQELRILEAHRQTLGVIRLQIANLGYDYSPPGLINNLKRTRVEIKEVKGNLRRMGIKVEDIPGEDEGSIENHENITISRKPEYVREMSRSLFQGDGILLGSTSDKYFQHLDIEYENYSVECDISILEDGGDNNNWAGFRLRGFFVEFDHPGFGYLTYLRSLGTVEVYRKRKVVGGENKKIIDDTSRWNRLRVDIFNQNIRVWVNNVLHIALEDKSFGGLGFVCLHTYFVSARFKNMDVYQIKL